MSDERVSFAAFLKRGGYNFILVDWSKFSSFPYLKAFYNLYKVRHA